MCSYGTSTVLPLRDRGRVYRKVVVLTGAGVSVASGLPSYRGPGGLWEAEPDLARRLVAGVQPAVVWQTLGRMRAQVSAAQPNSAHRALAEFEQRVVGAGGSLTLITQNIDGLHQRAGSCNLIELHGRLCRTRCSNAGCELTPYEDDSMPMEAPTCRICGAPLRPDVVLFNEPLGAREEVGAKRSLRDCDLFVAIGTSGTVSPACNFVRSAEYEGAHTIYLNQTPMSPPNPAFCEVILSPAEDAVPVLLGA